MTSTADTIHYVIGDIHGQDEQLCALLDAIQSRHTWKHPEQRGKLIYLGDYIDRGAGSKAVIERVMRGVEGFDSIYLKGNHEALILDCLETEERPAWGTWMAVGGRPTLKSFGYDLAHERYNSERLSEVLGDTILQWLQSLQIYYRHADFLCVHAGLIPNVLLEHQNEKDLLWVRRKFLDSDFDFGFGVIHGHTSSQRPVVKRNRIGIDTGAGKEGELTALIVDRAWADLVKSPTFISV
ncbi:MAG: metallophosphoesterase family protein [Pseudomonadota bacterium]